jgi:hypothetical protein
MRRALARTGSGPGRALVGKRYSLGVAIPALKNQFERMAAG